MAIKAYKVRTNDGEDQIIPAVAMRKDSDSKELELLDKDGNVVASFNQYTFCVPTNE